MRRRTAMAAPLFSDCLVDQEMVSRRGVGKRRPGDRTEGCKKARRAAAHFGPRALGPGPTDEQAEKHQDMRLARRKNLISRRPRIGRGQ